MPILRPYFTPYTMPQPAQLLPKLQQQQLQAGQNGQQQSYFQPQPSIDPLQQLQQQQFEQPSFNTADRLGQQFDFYKQNRQNQFHPTPQANNPLAATGTNAVTNFMQSSSARPSFQEYYDQLHTISDTGIAATAASTARSAYNQQQSFAGLGDVGAGASGGFGTRVDFAKSLIGVPYVWGHQDKNGTDCSGLVYQVLNASGVKVGRTNAAGYGRMGTAVGLGQAVPGDIVYFDHPGATDHVGIYIGNGKMIDAPFTGAKVRIDSIGNFTSIRRIGTPKTGTTPMGINAGLGGSPGANKALGQQLLAQAGLGAQWNPFNALVMSESGWNNKAQNPTSTAFGIGQFLNNTWNSFGPKTSDPRTQILYMIKYVLGRYGSPEKAWRFKQQHGWY